MTPLGDGRVLARARTTSEGVVLDSTDVVIATLMNSPASVDWHVERIVHALPPLTRPQALQRVERLLGSRCLATSAGLIASVLAGTESENGGGLAPRTCAIPTLGRPRQLERLVASLPRLGWETSTLISGEWEHDSPPELAACLRAAGRGARVLTRGGRREEAQRLARRAGVDPRLAEWALCGADGTNSPGANRNALLLAARDGGVLFLDDDVVVDPRGRSTQPPALTASKDPRWVQFAPTVEAALECTPVIDGGTLEPWMHLLGASTVGWLRTQTPPHDGGLRELTPHLARMLSGGSRVAGVSFGVVGDLGVDSPIERLYVTGEVRDALVGDANVYQWGRTTRCGLRVTPGVVVGVPGACQTYALALDTVGLLPPFLPTGRGEDGLFGVVLHVAQPTACWAHAPVALPHLPSPVRPPFTDTDWTDVRTVWTSTLLGCIASSLAGESYQQPAARLETLGREIEALASLPAPTFWREATRTLAISLAQQVQGLSQLLAFHRGEPHWWAADVHRRIGLLEERMTAPEPPLFHDGSPEDVQACVRRYGALLQAWPAIWGRAREDA